MQTKKALVPLFLIVFLILTFLPHEVHALSTFGYTSKGGTATGPDGTLGLKTIFALSEAGSVSVISVYIKNNAASSKSVDVGIYTGTTLTYRETFNCPGSNDAFIDFTLTTPQALAAGDYGLAMKENSGQDNMVFYYAAGSANQAQADTGMTKSANLANPFDVNANVARQYSIHADYTPGGAGQNLYFNLTAVPTITATLNKGIEIFKALSGAPAFTSSITYGLEWFFNLSEIPKATVTLVYGKVLALSFSEIPKFIAELVAEKGKNAVFDLSIVPAFIADLAKNVEFKRSLSEIPKIIVDMTKEIELGFVEFVLTEVPIFTVTLETLIAQALSTADMALALGIMAFVIALAALALAVLMKH